jgi:ribosome recycling factor
MSEVINKINKDAEGRMKKSLETLKHGIEKIRTGRANPALLENITVEYYGSRTPLSQVASVSVADARTLSVTPWDKTMVQPIEKAIMESGLGLNPNTSGQVIRVPLPALTEERRKEFGKLVRKEGEEAKIAVRNVRATPSDAVKKKDRRRRGKARRRSDAETYRPPLRDRQAGGWQEQELLFEVAPPSNASTSA